MPDRYGTPDDDQPDQPRLDTIDAQRLARARCTLCDDDGYRCGLVCDHIDHASAARRGMIAVSAALRAAKKHAPSPSPQTTHKNPSAEQLEGTA